MTEAQKKVNFCHFNYKTLQTWFEKAEENKLEYEVKSYNAKKQLGDSSVDATSHAGSKSHLKISTSTPFSIEQVVEKKPVATPKKAPEVVAKPKTLKKDDSLSSFTSDDDIKPGKFPKLLF